MDLTREEAKAELKSQTFGYRFQKMLDLCGNSEIEETLSIAINESKKYKEIWKDTLSLD